MNKKRNILIIVVILILSQWLMVKLVYAHKITGPTARFLASVYQLKAGIIEDESKSINIYLKDFFVNKEFASKLLVAQATISNQFVNLDVSDQEISDLVWNKLLKQAWLNKLSIENNIDVTQEDIDYYIDIFGGQGQLEILIKAQGVSVDEYKHFLIEADILENKIYNHLLANFADERGVLKIQEAYAFLESENGSNWDTVVEKYGEDTRLSENSFWLSEEELIDAYEAIKEVDKGGFSKIVQVPGGYIIWHVDNILKDGENVTKEVRGIFIYAQTIEDFFNTYLDSVSVERKY